MKEAPGSSETSVLTRATRRNNPEDTILNRIMNFITALLHVSFKLYRETIGKREIKKEGQK
jgi:hypothetical protein